MGEPRTGAPLDDGGAWTGSEEGSEEGTGGSEGVGGDGGPDAEGVWSPDIEQSFQEALAIYPPCGRRKIILSDEGKMYGRNELIARYIKLRTGKTRTRKQVSSHIQVLARRKSREIQSKLKDQVSKDKAFQTMATMSSAQLISAPSLQAKLGPSGPQTTELFQFWSGNSGAPWNVPDVKPFSQTPFSVSLTPPSTDLPAQSSLSLRPGLQRPLLLLLRPSRFQRHLFVHISQQCPSPGAPPLESVDVRQIYDKFPEKKGGLRELYDRGPPHAFFLVKFWVSAPKSWLYQSGTRRVLGLPGPPFRDKTNTTLSSQYESRELMTLTCSSKVCSFGKQVVEKVETERAQLEDGRFVYRLMRSPMCEYLVNFLDTQELLLCTAYVFEVSTSEHGAQHHIYRLVRD
ncbi:transcriptional enhancer factor TEF-4 [Microtus ochrogaster]|uniref:Transcriptional enhancer factor TEF-4 n=1 Tax=Microtus ochrogaster TaxID=79684 RepID=A0ABM1USA5_MICOH|nr:transcriptional enhancer factor TEF-4 [Microtus ochrogaster]